MRNMGCLYPEGFNVSDNFGRNAVAHNSPLLHDNEAIGVGKHLFQIVGDH